MSFFGSLFGGDQADAARGAASDTYTKMRATARDFEKYGDEYLDQFRGLSDLYAPYAQTGLQSNTALQRLLADPSSVSSLPGYQFQLDQGVNALDRSAAARGMLNSGAQQKALLRYGQGLADTTYGNQLQRLMGLNQQGLGATGMQANTVGQGLAGQMGTRQSAYNTRVASAPVLGQGDIAAANAMGQGALNAFNLGTNALGMLAGGFPMGSWFGGSSGGGGR